MEDQEEFYAILGLEGSVEVSSDAIRKAYRSKALLCHPDKRPDDPLAAVAFQKLQKAYDVLSDEKARKAYDDLLNVRKARLEKENRADSKRRKMMEDLRKRESFFETQRKERDDEESAFKRLQEEITRIRATRGQKGNMGPVQPESSGKTVKGTDVENQEKIMKVSWTPAKNGGSDYSVVQLQYIFSQFGQIEDIVMLQKKIVAKQCSALVVMSSRDEVLSVLKQRCGDLKNPLLVVPLVAFGGGSGDAFASPSAASANTGESTNLRSLVGNAFHNHEDSILAKMRKKAEQLKSKE